MLKGPYCVGAPQGLVDPNKTYCWGMVGLSAMYCSAKAMPQKAAKPSSSESEESPLTNPWWFAAVIGCLSIVFKKMAWPNSCHSQLIGHIPVKCLPESTSMRPESRQSESFWVEPLRTIVFECRSYAVEHDVGSLGQLANAMTLSAFGSSTPGCTSGSFSFVIYGTCETAYSVNR